MAKRKTKDAVEEVVENDWKLAEGSDGPFKASISRVRCNPYRYGPSGDIDFQVELLFDSGNGTEGMKPLPFYMDWSSIKPAPTVSDIIDFMVTKIVAVGASAEAKALPIQAPGNDKWERWFHVRHCKRLTSEFKTMIGDDMFSAIAAPDVPNEPAST